MEEILYSNGEYSTEWRDSLDNGENIYNLYSWQRVNVEKTKGT